MGNVKNVIKKNSLIVSLILLTLSFIMLSGCNPPINNSGKAIKVVDDVGDFGGGGGFYSCIDSDGGSYPKLMGSCEDQGGSFSDSCFDQSTINEYSCLDNLCNVETIPCSPASCISGTCSSCDDGIRNGDEEGVDCGTSCGKPCFIPPIKNLNVNLNKEGVIVGEKVTFNAEWDGGIPDYELFISNSSDFINCGKDNQDNCLCFNEMIEHSSSTCDYFPSQIGKIIWYAKVCDQYNCTEQSINYYSPSENNKVFYDSDLRTYSTATPNQLGITPSLFGTVCEIVSCPNQAQSYSLLSEMDNQTLNLNSLSSDYTKYLRSYLVFNFNVTKNNVSSLKLSVRGYLKNYNFANTLKIYYYNYQTNQWVDTQKQIYSASQTLLDVPLTNTNGILDPAINSNGILTFLFFDLRGDIANAPAGSSGGGGGSPIMRFLTKQMENSFIPIVGDFPNLIPPLIGCLILFFALLIKRFNHAKKLAISFALLFFAMTYSIFVVASIIATSNYSIDYVHLTTQKEGIDSGVLQVSECTIPTASDWIINGNCKIIQQNIAFPTDKKIIINEFGTLALEKASLTFSSAINGSSGISSLSGSHLSILESNITNSDTGGLFFKSTLGSTLIIEKSILSGFGYEDGNLENSGLWVGSYSPIIKDSIISSQSNGIILQLLSNALIKDNILDTKNGITLLGSSNNEINGNLINSNTYNGSVLRISPKESTLSYQNKILNNNLSCANEGCVPLSLDHTSNNSVENNYMYSISKPCLELNDQSIENLVQNNDLIVLGKTFSILSLLNSNNNNFVGNNILNPGDLTPNTIFSLKNSNNNQIVSNEITESIDLLSVPYHFENSGENKIINSTIRDYFNVQVESTGYGENKFISSSIDKSKIYISPDSSSSIKSIWILDLLVLNSTQSPILSKVGLKNAQGEPYLSIFTDNNGNAQGLNGIEFVYSLNNLTVYNPQIIYVNSEGYSQYEETIEINSDMAKTITLQRMVENLLTSSVCADIDFDRVCDSSDNCLNTSNPGQEDTDKDSLGDACDDFPDDPLNDLDGDKIGGSDNCPSFKNPDQSNRDNDQFGDECDACPDDPYNDIEGDYLCANEDNCPFNYNPSQSDCDGNGIGDACDKSSSCMGDKDNDGIIDVLDNCPEVSNSLQEDSDKDSVGDACDMCVNDKENDKDMDEVCADVDNCPSIYNYDQSNSDGDRFGDACDKCIFDSNNDIDFDGVCGNINIDNCQNKNNPSQADCDKNGIGDACDQNSPCSGNDIDFDTIPNANDNCPEIANKDQIDSDNDGIGNICDKCPFDNLNDFDMDGLCNA